MSDRSDKAPQTPGAADPGGPNSPANSERGTASSADASGGRSPLRPSAVEVEPTHLRLRALALAVQMIGKQTGRTYDVLAEADKLLAWVVRGAPALSAD